MVNETGEILEVFKPQLDETYTLRFDSLIQRIDSAFPNYRSQTVRNELKNFTVDYNDVESLKYFSALSVLMDLCQQGWQLEVSENQLYLKMGSQGAMDKAQ